uniref:Double minute 2 protein n=1 Tax=Petromyzon marinus TaxID=7757 RepID=S4RSA8_PETMA
VHPKVYDVTVIYSDSQSSYNESSDAEFPEEDGWRCTECSETNHPMHGYCQRCWCLRKDWLPDAEALARDIDSDDGHDEIDGRRSKKAANEDDEYEKVYEKKSSKSEALQPADVVSAASSASASSAYQNDGRSGSGGANNACTLLDMCIICQHEPRSCTIVHGKTGHLVTCYMCAKKLKRRNKPCPVCRSPIQAVIKTYLL